jgi:hypothetical protein
VTPLTSAEEGRLLSDLVIAGHQIAPERTPDGGTQADVAAHAAVCPNRHTTADREIARLEIHLAAGERTRFG